eukprot:11131639-Ditylum_brightwellii.AAC.1
MRTGEGKTLVATLPVYLHALTGKRRGHPQPKHWFLLRKSPQHLSSPVGSRLLVRAALGD